MLDLISGAVTTTIANIVLFGTIPVIWWGVSQRKKTTFANFVGLTQPKLMQPVWLLVGFLILYVLNLIYGENLIFSFIDKNKLAAIIASSGSSKGEFAGLGLAAVVPAFIVNVIGNGFCEELFFRGFLVGRFKTKMKGLPAVITVAVLFSAMHNILFLVTGLPVGLDYHIASFLFVAIGSTLLGIANEKFFSGSIWPSILLHGLGNYIFTLLEAFQV